MKDLKIDESTGLVLEGGGMRGVFTCGVLDYFMDHDIRFPYAIGVSAGACNGLSYASRQRGREKKNVSSKVHNAKKSIPPRHPNQTKIKSIKKH